MLRLSVMRMVLGLVFSGVAEAARPQVAAVYGVGPVIWVSIAGSQVVMRKCPNTPKECKGTEVRLPLAKFQETLREYIRASGYDEIKEYYADLQMDSAEISRQVGDEAIEKVVAKILNSERPGPLKLTQDQDSALYRLLSQYSPSDLVPCGLAGTLRDRIKDCQTVGERWPTGWKRVMFTAEGVQVWQGATGWVWSGLVYFSPQDAKAKRPEKMNWEKAMHECGSRALQTASIPGVNFKIPSTAQMQRAVVDGIAAVFDEKADCIWSHIESSSRSAPWNFSVKIPVRVAPELASKCAVRCVGLPLNNH